MSDENSLDLHDVSIALGGHTLVPPLSLRVRPGEVVTIMGPSGSGKSTLLSFLCGTLDPAFRAAGRVRLRERWLGDLPPEQRRIRILFQDDLLFPHLSVGENLAFGLRPGLSRAERQARIAAALEDGDLTGFQDRDPATLSGGQRARIALLRTLMAAPHALLLDEPFSKLDMTLRDRVRRFVFDHARDRALPTLLVTHDPADADAAGGPVLTIGSAGDDLVLERPAGRRRGGPAQAPAE